MRLRNASAHSGGDLHHVEGTRERMSATWGALGLGSWPEHGVRLRESLHAIPVRSTRFGCVV